MEVQNNGGNSNLPIINYGVSMSAKKIYHSQKEPGEFYSKIELKSGGFVYHRYIDALQGTICYLAIDKSEYGTKLKMLLKSEKQLSALQFSIDSQAFRSLVLTMYNVLFTEEIKVSFYKGENKKYPDNPYQNCYISYPNKKYEEEGKIKFEVPERIKSDDCPDSKQLQTGKWNHDDRDEWYYIKAQEIILRFSENKVKQKPIGSFMPPVTSSEVQLPEVFTSQDEDELPF